MTVIRGALAWTMAIVALSCAGQAASAAGVSDVAGQQDASGTQVATPEGEAGAARKSREVVQTRAEREVEALIAGLGTSHCEFERNGTWYDAAQAQSHLRGKYEELRKRGQPGSAEKFIERGASESSTSGKNYQVRCPGKPVTESGIWFRALLTRLRTQPDAPSR
jgi:Family of unknown function (DUF5329)